MTSFVVMDRDRRTYRFLKDTRLGRSVLLETANLNDMADIVTNYVAERIIERERAIEGDWLIKRATPYKTGPQLLGTPQSMTTSAAPPDWRVVGWIVAAFIGGLLIGLIVLLAYTGVAVPI